MNMNENRYHSMPVSRAAQSSRTRKPWQHVAGRRLIARLRPETPGTQKPLAPINLRHPETSGSTPPPGQYPSLNFACNSPTTLSNFESTSLRFRGFLDIANWSDDRIACEIGGELRCATPNASTHCPVRTLTSTTHKPARTDIKIPEILRSVDEHSRHNRRIVMACAHLCRWCAHSHFALQLLGF